MSATRGNFLKARRSLLTEIINFGPDHAAPREALAHRIKDLARKVEELTLRLERLTRKFR